MIILEGPDKAGKSTLAKLICEEYNANYFHFDNPRAGICHIDQFCDELQQQPFNTVFDRGCLSALVYDFKAPTDPSRVMTTLPMMRRGFEAMEKHRALLVMVRPDDEVLKKRLSEEGDANDYVNEREMLFTAHLYDLIDEWARGIGFHNRITFNSGTYLCSTFLVSAKFEISRALDERYNRWRNDT